MAGLVFVIKTYSAANSLQINVSGWVFLVATGGALGSQLIIGIIALTDPVGSPCAHLCYAHRN